MEYPILHPVLETQLFIHINPSHYIVVIIHHVETQIINVNKGLLILIPYLTFFVVHAIFSVKRFNIYIGLVSYILYAKSLVRLPLTSIISSLMVPHILLLVHHS